MCVPKEQNFQSHPRCRVGDVEKSSKSCDIYPFTFQGHQDAERVVTQASSQPGSQQREPSTGLQPRSISCFFPYARFPRWSPRRGFSWREIPLALHRRLGQCVRAFCELAASHQVESTFLDDKGCRVSSQPPKSQKLELNKGWQRCSPAVTCSPLLPLPTWLLPEQPPITQVSKDFQASGSLCLGCQKEYFAQWGAGAFKGSKVWAVMAQKGLWGSSSSLGLKTSS